MVTAVGLLACIFLAVLPAAVHLEPHVLVAGSIAALICTGGLLIPSLGLALTGAVGSILVFSTTLLIAPSDNGIVQAIFLGIALFALLDATHYRLRFRGKSIDAPVVRWHLLNLAASTAVSLGVAMLFLILAIILSVQLDLSIRPLVAAAGAVLTMAAALGATRTGKTCDPNEGDVSE